MCQNGTKVPSVNFLASKGFAKNFSTRTTLVSILGSSVNEISGLEFEPDRPHLQVRNPGLKRYLSERILGPPPRECLSIVAASS